MQQEQEQEQEPSFSTRAKAAMQRMQRTLVDADCSTYRYSSPRIKELAPSGEEKRNGTRDRPAGGGSIMSLREGKGQSKTEEDMVKVIREKQ